MTQSTNFAAGTVVTKEWLNAVDEHVFDEYVSVLQHGAVGDGTTDDTTAIQAAIDAVYSIGGGEVWFPEGQYKISSPIYMKRGVSLIGPEHKISSAQIYESNAEATIAGIAKIVPTSAITLAALVWDFSLSSRAERPYGAVCRNLMLDCRNQTAGSDGIYVKHAPTGEGPFDNGWASGAVRIINTVVIRAPRYGAYVLSTSALKTNAQFVECRFAFSGSHGIMAVRCFDVMLDKCFSFANTGDGVYLEGCATERILNCDIFNNTGHGLTLDGYNGRYAELAVDHNGKHGINIICSVSSTTNKKYRFIGGNIDTNGSGTDNTYSNIYIGDLAGVGISGVSLVGIGFGDATQTTSNRLLACITASVAPTQYGNYAAGCFFSANDVTSGNAIFNDAFWQNTTFASCSGSEGNPVATKPRTLNAWTGSSTPNTLRGASFYKTANTGAAVISGIINSNANYVLGREIWILIDDVNTGVDFTSSTLKGNGGVDLAAPCQGKLLHCKNYDSTNWAVQIYG